MHPSSNPRERLVRDYSTDGVFTRPVKQPGSPTSNRDRYISPQRSTRTESLERPMSRDEDEDARKFEFGLERVEENSNYEPSISTQPTSVSSRSRLADFFGPEVFQIVLQNPTTAHQLKLFAKERLCGENLEFLEKIDEYQHSLNNVTKTIFDIHRNFVSVHSPSQVNLPDDVLVQINKNLKNLLSKTMPTMESVFITAQNDIQKLVASDIYPRFVRHQMTLSATRALASNKNKYAGLGDCFVLTDPSKADNPIVYASDGFVKVSGYARNEIIPRNCRFLQTRQTDRESVARIKKAVEERSESVELLLNERKTGEPFWNLLYTAPLYDSTGKLAFFIGGQINVSTTIHSTSDVLRILSAGSGIADENENDNKEPKPVAKSYRQSLFSTLRRSKAVPGRTPGMEPALLNELEQMSFKQQKDAFYSAYSKYLIVNTNSMMISFHSAGITELLYPTRGTTGQSQIAGQDIFKFLNQHANNNLPREYKSRVKTACKNGDAVTLDLSLCTRRIMGYEQFLTHWTPLKDDVNAVAFMVLTFGSLQDAR